MSILAANCCCQNVNSMDMQMFSACYYLIFIISMLRSSGEIRQLRDREWANYIVSRGQSINWNWSGIYSNLMIDSPVEQWGMWFLNISEMKTKLKVTQLLLRTCSSQKIQRIKIANCLKNHLSSLMQCDKIMNMSAHWLLLNMNLLRKENILLNVLC